MMRSRFDSELAKLSSDLTKMGALCEETILAVAKEITERDEETYHSIVAFSEEITRMERGIEQRCIRLLLQQQPVARDLRQISAALKMITDMNRIGIQAADIAEIISFMEKRISTEQELLKQEAMNTMEMVRDSVDSYVRRDVNLANEVIEKDDVVDEMFDNIKKELIKLIAEDQEGGVYALDLLMIAKYLERIGDHAVNIAEWVIFSVTGIHKGEA